MTQEPLINIPLQTAETALPEASEILSATEKEVGFVPNMYANMANMPAILTGYMASYKAFRENAGFTPAEQETVFLSISKVNNCSYCMAAHSMLADQMSGVPATSLDALRNGTKLPDPKLEALAVFTRAMVENRGAPKKEDVDAFLGHGFEPDHVLGIVVAIAAKTYSNYVNHLAATQVDPAFASYSM